MSEQWLMARIGKVDPVSSESYASMGGYEMLKKALDDPAAIIGIVTASGLRGRGGAGFPTGQKWQMVKDEANPQKYIVCNADEGEPGTNKDRLVLENDPHSVLEGMAIAGVAVGADRGVIYVRAEYPYIYKTLCEAVADAEEHGYLGMNMMGSGINFSIEVKSGEGAYLCGEETALLESIEGKRGETRSKPPYPTSAGLWGCPTVINNVETMADIPIVMRVGDEYTKVGTEKCPGTKLFTISGNVEKPGVYEAPMGTTIRELLDMAGGMKDGSEVYAIQTGGCSGPIVGPDKLDVAMAIEECQAAGCSMGTGDLMFLNKDTNLVDLCRNITDFYAGESCGKCVPCRLGLHQLVVMLDEMMAGKIGAESVDELSDLADHTSRCALCPLGAAGPAPLQAVLKNFRADFIADIAGKG